MKKALSIILCMTMLFMQLPIETLAKNSSTNASVQSQQSSTANSQKITDKSKKLEKIQNELSFEQPLSNLTTESSTALQPVVATTTTPSINKTLSANTITQYSNTANIQPNIVADTSAASNNGENNTILLNEENATITPELAHATAVTSSAILVTSVTGSAIVADESDFAFDASTGTITRYIGSGGDVEIPKAINGVSVNLIGEQAFSGCTGLTSITIPNSVTNIGAYAFDRCSGLTNITISNSVTSIGERAFDYCTGLKGIVIPDSVKSIGNYAFSWCDSLESITLPNSLCRIKEGLFMECISLTSITIPDSVAIIEQRAFYYCWRLASITLPDSLTTIDSYAFYWCLSLDSIIIPYNLTVMGDMVFGQCHAILTIYAYPDSYFSQNLVTVSYDDDRENPIFYETYNLEEPGACYEIPVLYIAHKQTVTIKITIPYTGDTNPYSNLLLRLVDKNNNTKMSVYTSKATQYSFGGLIDGESYKAVLTNKFGNIIGESNYIVATKGDNIISFENLLQQQTVSLTVKDSLGANVTNSTIIKWYDSNNNFIAEGNSIPQVTNGTNLFYTIKLNSTLGKQYSVPDKQSYTIVEGNNNLIFTLIPISTIIISGKITDKDDSKAVANAVVSISQLLNGKYSNNIIVTTDSNGLFSAMVYNDKTSITVSKSNYINMNISDVQTNFSGSSYNIGEIQIAQVTGAKIMLDMTYYYSVETGGTPIVNSSYYNSTLIVYTIYNQTQGKEINDFSVQYPYIIVLKGANAGDVISITATSRDNDFKAVTTTITLDSNLEATAMLDIVQNGSFKATYTTSSNSNNVAIVYDSDGKYVTTIDFYSAQAVSNVLPEGNYTIVFITKSLFLNNIQSLSNFSSVGLTEKVDYSKTKVQITAGTITTIDSIEIPALDESQLYYTDNTNTTFTVNKTDVVAGSFFTLRAAYKLNDTYKNSASNIKIIIAFPDNCQLFSNSVLVGNYLSYNYVTDGNTVIIPVANATDIIRFCAVPLTAGKYNINAFLQFDINGKTIKQPIGVVSINANAITINVPEKSAQKTVTISGMTMPSSVVTVYDNGVVVGQTKALANGNWSVDVQLYRHYTYSLHDIYAEVNTQNGEKFISVTNQMIYDANCIEVSKVTMITNDSSTIFDFLHPASKSQVYNYNPNYPTFTFKVEFINNDLSLISNVYVNVWTADGGVTMLSAIFDEYNKCWIASNTFDSNHLPVNVSVNYDCISTSASLFDEEEQKQQLQELQDDLLKADTSTEYEITADVIGDAEDYVEILFNSEDFSSNALWISKLETLDYNSFDIDKLENYGFVVWDITESGTQYCKMEISDVNILMTFIDTETKFAGLCTMEFDYTEVLPLVKRSTKTDNKIKLFSTNQLAVSSPSINFSKIADFMDILSLLDEFNKDREYVDLALIPGKNYSDFLSELVSVQSVITLKCKDGTYALSNEDMINATNALKNIDNAYKTFCDEENNIMTAYKAQLGLNLLNGYLLGKLAKCTTDKLGTLGTLEKVKNYPNLSYWKSIFNKSPLGLITCYLNVQNAKIANWIAEETDKWLSSKDLNYATLKPYFMQEHAYYMKQLNDINTGIISRYKCDVPTPTPTPVPPQGPNAKPILDPSGYVYEAVASNRLAGVTTTIYYKQNLTDTTSTLWDASEYQQDNPLTTDANGAYAWDVPFGYWQVKYEKEGYQTTYSEWLPVPPPQVEVNVGIISYVQPNVTRVTGYNDYIELVFDKYMQTSTLTTDNIKVTNNGAKVTGRIQIMNAEVNPNNDSEQFATKVRFIPDSGQFESGDNVQLTVNSNVASYANVNMNAEYSTAVVIQTEPKGITATNTLNVAYGESGNIDVVVLPKEAAVGKKITAVSSSLSIVSVVTEVTIDADGKATIPVTANLPGTSYITFTLEGTDIQSTTTVQVAMPIQTVSAPTASVQSGTTVPINKKITLSTATAGAEIYYTTDGSCPCSSTNTSRIKYTDPIIITQNTVISAVATMTGMTDSKTMAFVYNVSTDAPVANINSGDVPTGTSITLLSTMAGAVIYYTLDGSTPTASSTAYTTPIVITKAITINAIAIINNLSSAVSTYNYTIATKVAKPVANPSGGTTTAGTQVSLSTTTQGATIYYTTDNTCPCTSDTRQIYTQPITINQYTTVIAYAAANGITDSNVLAESYVISGYVSTPIAIPAAKEIKSGTAIKLSVITDGATIYYTTDGNTPNKNSNIYISPIVITNPTTIKAIAVKDGLIDSLVMSVSYTILEKVAAPVANLSSGSVKSGTQVTLTTATEGASIYYSLDGTIPTEGSTKYSVPIKITSSTTIKAIAIKDGLDDSIVMSVSYAILGKVTAPVASPSSGSVSSGTQVSLTTATSGATIWYTLDGTTPTKESKVYTAPIVIRSATTIKAIAIKTDMDNSNVLTADFTLITHTVIFKNWDGNIIKTETVNDGEGATAPSEPTRSGYVFKGWDIKFNNVKNDMTVTAVFETTSPTSNDPTGGGNIPTGGGQITNESSKLSQAALSVSGIPASITYGDSSFDLSTTGGNGTGIISYSVTSGEAVSISGNTVTIVKAGNATITVTKAGDSNYNSITVTINLIVNKAVVTIVSLPKVVNTVFVGDTLSTVVLAGGTASVTGTFTWEAPKTILKKSGNYKITFTPTDSENYMTVNTFNGKRATVKVFVLEEPKTLAFKMASKTIALDQSFEQKVIVDENRNDITVTYTSSKPSVAIVNEEGKVTPKKIGTTYITATTPNGLTATYKIVVKKSPIKVTLRYESLILMVGKTNIIKPSVGEGYYATFTYTSSDKGIATVSKSGKITAKKAGTTIITIKTHNGLIITCKITVK